MRVKRQKGFSPDHSSKNAIKKEMDHRVITYFAKGAQEVRRGIGKKRRNVYLG